MKFIEIVETIEGIETKLQTLSEAQLGLMESIFTEGADHQFDVVSHLDHLIKFVSNYSDENATTISETVDCGEVLNIILESVRKNSNDFESFISESTTKVGDLDIKLNEQDAETVGITLLSVVTNKLTEMFGESKVESMPAEMVFDIVESTKSLDISDRSVDMDMTELVEEISTNLEKAIKSGKIDFDTDNYGGETLSEFLDDYDNTEDLLQEMTKVNEEVLAESENKDAARLLSKAKSATILVEAKMKRCAPGDLKCMLSKAKKAKVWYSKNEMPGGGDVNEINPDSLNGRLGKHVKAAIKAFKKTHGKEPTKDLVQFLWIPGIIKRMRMKARAMGAKSQMKKAGMQ